MQAALAQLFHRPHALLLRHAPGEPPWAASFTPRLRLVALRLLGTPEKSSAQKSTLHRSPAELGAIVLTDIGEIEDYSKLCSALEKAINPTESDDGMSRPDRLRNFVQKAAQATLVGEVFDDAATGQGLLNYFLRAVNCGAITEEEALERSGLTLEELRGRSFVKILESRRG